MAAAECNERAGGWGIARCADGQKTPVRQPEDQVAGQARLRQGRGGGGRATREGSHSTGDARNG